MENIYPITLWDFDREALLKEAEDKRDSFKLFEDVETGHKVDWLVLREQEQETLPVLFEEYQRFVWDFGLHDYYSKPRYYILEAGKKLPTHVDSNTKCSVNVILNNNHSLIQIEDKIHLYKQALINTQKKHSVDNTNGEDRIIMRISFFDISFEKLKKLLTLT